MDQIEIVKQINRVVGGKKFDFWLINAQNRCKNLLDFFGEVEVPSEAEILTSEMLFPGSYLESLKRSECV